MRNYAGIDGQGDMKLIYGTRGLGIQHKGRRGSKSIWVITTFKTAKKHLIISYLSCLDQYFLYKETNIFRAFRQGLMMKKNPRQERMIWQHSSTGEHQLLQIFRCLIMRLKLIL